MFFFRNCIQCEHECLSVTSRVILYYENNSGTRYSATGQFPPYFNQTAQEVCSLIMGIMAYLSEWNDLVVDMDK